MPRKLLGHELDIMARQYLFHEGYDFKHGVGHGVGFCLNVHESPPNISPLRNTMEFENNMCVTNEPGVYLDGKFGIRIENLLAFKSSEKGFYFENLTYMPYEAKLFDFNLISMDFKNHINEYHENVMQEVGPLLKGDSLKWLKSKTKKIV